MIYGLYDPLDNLLYVGETTQESKKALSSLWSKRSKRAGALGEWLRSLEEKPRIEVLEAGDTDAGRLDHWLDRVGRERLTNDKETFAEVEVDKPRPDQDVPEETYLEMLGSSAHGETKSHTVDTEEPIVVVDDPVGAMKRFMKSGVLPAGPQVFTNDTGESVPVEKPAKKFAVVVLNDSMGNIEAHLAGCADIKKRTKAEGSVHYGGHFNNRVEVAADYYDDQIEESSLTAADFVGDIDFKPCLGDLPYPYDELDHTEKLVEVKSEETVPEASKKPRKPSKLRGRKLSPEHRAKISAALKSKPLSDEHKAKISRGQRGKKLSDEHRRKLSLAWERRRARKAAEQNDG